MAAAFVGVAVLFRSVLSAWRSRFGLGAAAVGLALTVAAHAQAPATPAVPGGGTSTTAASVSPTHALTPTATPGATETAAIPIPAVAAQPDPAAAPDLRITAASTTQDLRRVGHWWLAPAGVGPDTALARAGARPLDHPAAQALRVDARDSVWAHVRLHFEAPVVPSQWRIQIPLPTLDLARIHTRSPGGTWQTSETGDHVTRGPRAIAYLTPALDLPASGAELEILLELHHPSGALSVPVNLASVDEVAALRTERALVAGALLGLTGLMGLLSLVEAVRTRSRLFGAFAAFLATAMLAVLVHTGVASIYFLGNWPMSAHWARFVVPALLQAAWTAITLLVLGFEERRSALRRAGNAWALFVALFGLALPWAGDARAIDTLQATLGLTLLINIGLCAAGLYLKRQHAGIALAALLVAGAGAGVTTLQLSGVMRFGPAIWDAFPSGVVIGAGLLFAVMIQRQSELLQAAARSGALASHDPLTGLPNEAALRYSFNRTLRRVQFHRTRALLVVVVVENLDEIAKEAGRAGPNETLVRLSARLRATLRPFDLLAKLENDRFAALVEGPVSAQQAQNLATRMLATALRMQVGGVTPRLVLAMTDVGSPGDQLEPYLEVCLRMIDTDPALAGSARSIRVRFSDAMEPRG